MQVKCNSICKHVAQNVRQAYKSQKLYCSISSNTTPMTPLNKTPYALEGRIKGLKAFCSTKRSLVRKNIPGGKLNTNPA